MQTNLTLFAEAFSRVNDPRSKQGTNLPLSGILAIVFLGLLAGQNYLAHIERWASNHWHILRKPLGSKRNKLPVLGGTRWLCLVVQAS